MIEPFPKKPVLRKDKLREPIAALQETCAIIAQTAGSPVLVQLALNIGDAVQAIENELTLLREGSILL